MTTGEPVICDVAGTEAFQAHARAAFARAATLPHDEHRRALRFVIVGGGYTGTALAHGEVPSLRRHEALRLTGGVLLRGLPALAMRAFVVERHLYQLGGLPLLREVWDQRVNRHVSGPAQRQ